GRRGFRPKGDNGRRRQAFLPIGEDRVVPKRGAPYRRACGWHWGRWARDRLFVRPIQTTGERIHRRPDRQTAQLGWLTHAARGDWLRRSLFRAGDAENAQ